MFVSAGSGSDDLWFNDIFLLDLGSWQWTQVSPVGGVAPSPRDYSTISTVAGRVSEWYGGCTTEGMHVVLDQIADRVRRYGELLCCMVVFSTWCSLVDLVELAETSNALLICTMLFLMQVSQFPKTLCKIDIV